jgi:hypothetical protein
MPWLFETIGVGVPDGTLYSGKILSTVDFAERDPRVLVTGLRDTILAHNISTLQELAELDGRVDAETAKHAGYVLAPQWCRPGGVRPFDQAVGATQVSV